MNIARLDSSAFPAIAPSLLTSSYPLLRSFFPPHLPTPIQHPLSPWKLLWNDFHLNECPKLCFIFISYHEPFELLLSFGFCDLVAPPWVLITSLSDAIPFVFWTLSPDVFVLFYLFLFFFFLSTGSFGLMQDWNRPVPQWLAGISLLFPCPKLLTCTFTFLRSQAEHYFSWGSPTICIIYLLWQTSAHSQSCVYSAVHFCLPLICCCLQLYLNFHRGTSETVHFRLKRLPEESLFSKPFPLPLLTNTLNNTILFLAFRLVRLKIMFDFPFLPCFT